MRRLEPDPRKTQVRSEERVDSQEKTPNPPTSTSFEPRRIRVPAASRTRIGEIEERAFAEVTHIEEESPVGRASHVSNSRRGAPNVVPATNTVALPEVPGFSPPERLAIVRPGAIPKRLNVLRPEVSEGVNSEDVPRDTPAVRRLERAVPPSVRAFERPAAFVGHRPAKGDISAAVKRAPISFSSESTEPDRGAPEIQIQPPPIAVRDTIKPVASPAIQPPAVATRETMARPLAPKIPVAAAAHPQPESSVQVTIGRVEVRAIFPEAPAARMPAPRARPTVSLDEYLKRAR